MKRESCRPRQYYHAEPVDPTASAWPRSLGNGTVVPQPTVSNKYSVSLLPPLSKILARNGIAQEEVVARMVHHGVPVSFKAACFVALIGPST